MCKNLTDASSLRESTLGVGLEPTTLTLTGSCSAIELPQIARLSYPGKRADATLDLRVAIRAQEDALSCLGSQPLDTPSHTLLRDAKLLRVRVQMMELKRRRAAIVATKPTAAARLGDEDRLRAPTTSDDGLLTTEPAAEVPPRVENMLDLAVSGTGQGCSREPCRPSSQGSPARPPAARPMRRQPVTPEPVPDRALAAVHPRSDLRDRQPRIDQRRELVARQTLSGRVTRPTDRGEPVSIDPVRHRRFVTPDPPPDLRQRQPFPQHPLQCITIHAPHCRRRLRRNSRAAPQETGDRRLPTPCRPSPRALARTRGRNPV